MSTNEPADDDVRLCRDCGGQIVWKEGQNRQGEFKMFPFNYPRVSERHHCDEYNQRRASQYKSMSNADKAKGIPCRVCGAPITFSEDQRSPTSGKMIPLELTLERHQHRTIQTRRQYTNFPTDTRRGGGMNDNETVTKPADEEIWGSEEDIRDNEFL